MQTGGNSSSSSHSMKGSSTCYITGTQLSENFLIFWQDLVLDMTRLMIHNYDLERRLLLSFCYLFFSVQEGQTRQYKVYATAAFRLNVWIWPHHCHCVKLYHTWITDINELLLHWSMAFVWGEFNYLRLLKLLSVYLLVVVTQFCELCHSLQQQTLKDVTL